MAIVSSRVTVAATATPLMTLAGGSALTPGSVFVKNVGGSSIYIGGAAVTAATGLELATGETIALDLRWDDDLYGITAAGTNVCHIMKLHQAN